MMFKRAAEILGRIHDGMTVVNRDGLTVSYSPVPGGPSWWVFDHPRLDAIPFLGNYLIPNGAPWTVIDERPAVTR